MHTTTAAAHGREGASPLGRARARLAQVFVLKGLCPGDSWSFGSHIIRSSYRRQLATPAARNSPLARQGFTRLLRLRPKISLLFPARPQRPHLFARDRRVSVERQARRELSVAHAREKGNSGSRAAAAATVHALAATAIAPRRRPRMQPRDRAQPHRPSGSKQQTSATLSTPHTHTGQCRPRRRPRRRRRPTRARRASGAGGSATRASTRRRSRRSTATSSAARSRRSRRWRSTSARCCRGASTGCTSGAGGVSCVLCAHARAALV